MKLIIVWYFKHHQPWLEFFLDLITVDALKKTYKIYSVLTLLSIFSSSFQKSSPFLDEILHLTFQCIFKFLNPLFTKGGWHYDSLGQGGGI